MDLEGSDGRERGEDDTSFERQSALFALSAADVLLVNMWAKVGFAARPFPAWYAIVDAPYRSYDSCRTLAARRAPASRCSKPYSR